MGNYSTIEHLTNFYFYSDNTSAEAELEKKTWYTDGKFFKVVKTYCKKAKKGDRSVSHTVVKCVKCGVHLDAADKSTSNYIRHMKVPKIYFILFN